jgi:phospholipid N-methyltransferase
MRTSRSKPNARYTPEVTSRSHALLFARNFLRYPKVLGSAVPSSRFLVDRLLGHVDWRAARLIVEYGPGVGTVTGEILRRMSPEARLIAIELNGEFVDFLGANYPDPRLRVVRGSALEVDSFLRELAGAETAAPSTPWGRADVIVSGIPFSTLSLDLRERILSKSYHALEPGGRLLVYQFSRAVLPHLRVNFREIREQFVPFNILPARVYCCTK